jgi:hypothetical protein
MITLLQSFRGQDEAGGPDVTWRREICSRRLGFRAADKNGASLANLYNDLMAKTVFPLSGDTFRIEVDISGVSLAGRREPLFPAVLSDELVDQLIGQLQIELASLAPEMKAELRKLRATSLFPNDDT